MLDRRLAELEVGAQIVRSINIMIVKIMDKSDPTCMTWFVFMLVTVLLFEDVVKTAFFL